MTLSATSTRTAYPSRPEGIRHYCEAGSAAVWRSVCHTEAFPYIPMRKRCERRATPSSAELDWC